MTPQNKNQLVGMNMDALQCKKPAQRTGRAFLRANERTHQGAVSVDWPVVKLCTQCMRDFAVAQSEI